LRTEQNWTMGRRCRAAWWPITAL